MKVSNRNAVFVIAETTKSVSHSLDNYGLNTESIRLQRWTQQILQSAKLKDKFKGDSSLVVHWGGKLVQDATVKEKVDFLTVFLLQY